MTENIRWGILGPGRIADQFATSISQVKDAELAAVGSRNRERADTFAEKFGIPRRHYSYEDLVADPEVDVVYVAVPHSFHKSCTLLALQAGKAVLCEKPFAINTAEVEEMVDCAREKKLFLMEGMWTRFFPVMTRLREIISSGAIGDVRMVTADFGFRGGLDPESRLFNPSLGGGALMDVGIYPVAFASMILGTPDRIESMATIGSTGVDEQAGVLMGYAGGEIAVLHTAIRTQTQIEAAVMGTEGQIRIKHPFYKSKSLTLTCGGKTETVEMPYESTGFQFEAAEVGTCLREGKTESEIIPLSESLTIMSTLDTIRSQWGLKYPME